MASTMVAWSIAHDSVVWKVLASNDSSERTAGDERCVAHSCQGSRITSCARVPPQHGYVIHWRVYAVVGPPHADNRKAANMRAATQSRHSVLAIRPWPIPYDCTHTVRSGTQWKQTCCF